MSSVKYFSLFIFACIIFINPASAGVNVDGSYSTSIPIEIAPGRQGVAPSLSLVYNSNVGNGMLGVGWSLVGIPYIQKDVNFPINYDGTDQYVGSGGRVLRVDEGKYWHYEEETFSRFEMIINDETLEPKKWIETKNDGTRYYYGTTDGSRVPLDSNNQLHRLWALSKVEDVHGNFYEITYSIIDGQIYPDEIEYTKGHETGPTRSITFEYESREDYYPNYRFKTLVKTTQRFIWRCIF